MQAQSSIEPTHIPQVIDAPAMSELGSCCSLPDAIETTLILPLYMQLLTLGSLMIIGHCSGMCGPLMMSFRFGADKDKPLAAASFQLLCYQFGKAITYMSAGAIAASIGLSLTAMTEIKSWMAYICILMALLILIQALSWWRPKLFSFIPSSWYKAIQTRIYSLQRTSSRYRQTRPIRGSILLGLSMSLLPCMLPFWVLGLAVSSGSPLHGSLLMGLLVVLNTPVLLLFALSPHLLTTFRKRSSLHLAPIALCCSALWMLLIGLGSLGYIGHFSFELGPTTIVFW